jgi:hypothetical protein
LHARCVPGDTGFYAIHATHPKNFHRSATSKQPLAFVC